MCCWCIGLITTCYNCDCVICNRCGYIIGTKEEGEIIDIGDSNNMFLSKKKLTQEDQKALELFDTLNDKCDKHRIETNCINPRGSVIDKSLCVNCVEAGYISDE